MSSDWIKATWGDVVTLQYGKSIRDYQNAVGDYPVYGTNGPIGWHHTPLCPTAGVIVGRKGAYRGIHFSHKPFFVIDTAFYLSPNSELDAKWAYYCLLTYDINGMDSGSAIPSTSRDEFYKLPVLLPPIEKQKTISDFLSKFDDRIALLRETNTTLEAIAQALFKSWFVDFDPVRAKQQGREPEGMDPTTATLFPDNFGESELGLVPTGWRASTLDEISMVGIGKTPPRKEQHWFSENPSDVRWVSIRDMGNSGAYISTTNEFLTAESIERFNVRLVPDNTVMLSFKMTIGRVAISDGEMTTNEAIAHFKSHGQAPLSTEFIYLHLKQFNYSTLSSTSSIADAVNSKTVKNIPILVPAPEVLAVFQDQISVIFQKIKNIEQQTRILTALRDTLLPRLISGQLRLPEIEAMVEEAPV